MEAFIHFKVQDRECLINISQIAFMDKKNDEVRIYLINDDAPLSFFDPNGAIWMIYTKLLTTGEG